MVKKAGITLLGLGPGEAGQMTRQAWDWLQSCRQVVLRTRQHPCVAEFPANLEVLSFDELYENGESFEQVYEQITRRVLEYTLLIYDISASKYVCLRHFIFLLPLA